MSFELANPHYPNWGALFWMDNNPRVTLNDPSLLKFEQGPLFKNLKNLETLMPLAIHYMKYCLKKYVDGSWIDYMFK